MGGDADGGAVEGAANVRVGNIDVPMLLHSRGSRSRSFSSIVSPSICSAAPLPVRQTLEALIDTDIGIMNVSRR
jgi:hypothetical protein